MSNGSRLGHVPFVILGPPNDCSMITLRPGKRPQRPKGEELKGAPGIPFGPKVTLTAFARTSTPFRMLARPSFENLISLCAPRTNEGLAFAAARRRALEEVLERCIVAVKEMVEVQTGGKEKNCESSRRMARDDIM